MTKGTWPVYTGKSFNLWEPDTGEYYRLTKIQKVTKHLQDKRVRAHKKSNSIFSEFDSNHLNDSSTLHCYRPRIAARQVTRATDSRTIISALLPPEVVAQHGARVLLWPDGTSPHERKEAFLLGLLSSMIVDWYARRVVDLNLDSHIFDNFPIPIAHFDDSYLDPKDGDPAALRVVEISGRLAAVDKRFKQWAGAVGVEVGSANDPDEKEALIHELDACVAHLYGLDEEDLACLYETFHTKPSDHADRHAVVLKYFRKQPWLKSS